MVYRVFTEKREGLRQEAETLAEDIRSFLGIPELTGIRILNRYDVEGITPELMEICKTTVFSEPPIDILTETLHHDAPRSLITEYLPGQFDQRADSAAQCIQLISRGEKPHVRTARVYLLYGELTDGQYETICRYLINPVESRRATEALPETLDIPVIRPEAVPVLTGFTTMDGEALGEFVKRYGLAMDDADLKCCRDYFIGEKRDPTLTEVRVLDTYWSDHCRHTTFGTHLEEVEIREPAAQAAYARYLALRRELGIRKPVTLMDIATIGAKALRARGKLENAVISGETNACTVRIKADADGREEDWLLLFKNETHNHPTEIEPFGGAATCIGGAIRDPLSGRAYVYQAMRITGAADPLAPAEETLPGKIPQRKLTTTAARGFSSYGNQVGVATGLAEEIYHPGYEAKRMELGAVIAAVPADHVRQEEPAPGDLVILLGGRTGRDGCGGATGSSKPHHMASVEECSAEVQKGNAPEERKLQRLFRDPEVTRRIKRCNDFGAGGVSVAIGELADGLRIDLDKVPLKYEGLDGTELAISESQERMAVVIAPEDAAGFIEKAYKENVEATPVAVVTAEKRLVMTWRGQRIVDISRAFLDTNGASRSKSALVEKAKEAEKGERPEGTAERWQRLAEDLNVCSQRGMAEHFDSTIGAGSVLMPFGGKYQRTPAQVMAAKIPLERGETHTCTVMAWGYDPVLTKRNPYAGAYRAVAESAAKLVASGAGLEESYFTFQEYFERLGNEPSRWGKPLAALLGALDAQMDLGIGSIGGKDSMSGSFEDMDVPPTLVSFGVSVSRTERILSPEFKRAGSAVTLLPIECAGDVPVKEAMLEAFRQVTGWIREGKLLSASAVTRGGGAAAILKACFGNRVGFKTAEGIPEEILFADMPGFVLEWKSAPEGGMLAGRTESAYTISAGGEALCIAGLEEKWEGKLEPVFPGYVDQGEDPVPALAYDRRHTRRSARKTAAPSVLIPIFPGTNCEYDTARAFREAGAAPRFLVVNTLSPRGVAESAAALAAGIRESQIVFLPGGFSGGDEPDGSGKFITAFFRNRAVKDAVMELLYQRDGLMAGICNGFQALIKLGLVPFGEIRDMDPQSPTLTVNRIGRHQSRLVRTRIASTASPWLMHCRVGQIHTMPVSNGEGRFICPEALLGQLIERGQIATQYTDGEGIPSMDIRVNPNGSTLAVEGLLSPDGRVFGKMGHSERYGRDLYKNVPGEDQRVIFRGAADYFK